MDRGLAESRLKVLQIYKLLQYIRKGDKKWIKRMVKGGVVNLINLTEPKDGIGVLNMAISLNNHDMVSYLLSLGALPDVQDIKGRTPIMLAAQLGNEEIMTQLIANQADLLLNDVGGHGVLFYCIYPSERHIQCLQLALKGGADVNNVSEQGVHVFQKMCEQADNCAPMCFLMLEAGADPKAINKITGMTALMAAAKAGSLLLARAILKEEGDPNVLSKERLTAVHLAAEAGSLELIQVLSAYGANMQVLTLKCWTALHYAATSGNAMLCRFLAQRGCNPKLKNEDDNLASQIAKACKQKAAAKELKKTEKQAAKYKCSPRILTFYDWSQKNQNEIQQACGEESDTVEKEKFVSVIEGLGAPFDTEQLTEIVSSIDGDTEMLNLNEFFQAENYIEKPFLHSSFLPKQKKGKGGKGKGKIQPVVREPSDLVAENPDPDLLKIFEKINILKMFEKITIC